MRPRLGLVKHTQMGNLGATSSDIGSGFTLIQDDSGNCVGYFDDAGQTYDCNGNLTSTAQDQAQPGFSWSSVFQGVSNLLLQQQVLAVNTKRSANGQPLLTAGQLTGGVVPGGITANAALSNPLVLIGGVAILLLVLKGR